MLNLSLKISELFHCIDISDVECYSFFKENFGKNSQKNPQHKGETSQSYCSQDRS